MRRDGNPSRQKIDRKRFGIVGRFRSIGPTARFSGKVLPESLDQVEVRRVRRQENQFDFEMFQLKP